MIKKETNQDTPQHQDIDDRSMIVTLDTSNFIEVNDQQNYKKTMSILKR